MSSFKYLDLCSGIGGFHFGLDELECVLACDLNKDCRETYYRNFNMTSLSDIHDIKPNNLPEYDILCAGFPCQSFSSAGLKKGWDDPRANVYVKIIEIIRETRPKIVLLENVKNLLTIDSGNVIQKIKQDFDELRYNMSYQVLNIKNFNIPQNRERVFMIAINKDYIDRIFDFTKLRRKKATPTICDFLEDNIEHLYLSEDSYKLLDDDIKKEQKSGLIFSGYLNANLRKKGAKENTEHLSRVHKQPNRIYHIDGVHPTLSSSEISGRYYIQDNIGIRKMTLNECYKIMGFPDTFIKHTKNNQAYRQIGNSVCPKIINSIQRELKRQGFISSPNH
uniref:DNA (cytosine-5-)-methyltransferase n=1 Tax=viral metagenome TaxID=1070528 RepID=A0A6C0LL19_9ZZZZ